VLRLATLHGNGNGAKGAAAALVAAAALGALLSTVSACDPGPHEVCDKTRLTADPGTVVVDGGTSYVQLTAHLFDTDKRRPVAGATLDFGFTWERSGLLTGEIPTDSSGTAVYRRSFDDLSLDQRVSGALKDPYVVRWNDPNKVNGVAYCEARANGTLPLAQLPKPPTP